MISGRSVQLALAGLGSGSRLGSVTLGRQRRSLEGDLDISTHRLENSGKVARPVFFLYEEGSSAPGARTHGRTDAQNVPALLDIEM